MDGGWLFVRWEVVVIVGHLGVGVGLYELRKILGVYVKGCVSDVSVCLVGAEF